MLQYRNRSTFIDHKVSEHHYKPPYFKKMEEYNREGQPLPAWLPQPSPMSAADVKAAGDGGALLVDLRSPEAYAGAFIPGSLALPLAMVPAYAGYLIDYGTDIILIPETEEQIKKAVRHFFRLGYDCVTGYLKGGMHSWEVGGYKYDRIRAVHASDLDKRLRQRENFTLLDVRKIDEYRQSRLAAATHIFLGELQDRIDEIDRGKPVITFCGSGTRAIIAASILKRHGFDEVEDSLGSMLACESIGCEVEEGP